MHSWQDAQRPAANRAAAHLHAWRRGAVAVGGPEYCESSGRRRNAAPKVPSLQVNVKAEHTLAVVERGTGTATLSCVQMTAAHECERRRAGIGVPARQCTA